MFLKREKNPRGRLHFVWYLVSSMLWETELWCGLAWSCPWKTTLTCIFFLKLALSLSLSFITLWSSPTFGTQPLLVLFVPLLITLLSVLDFPFRAHYDLRSELLISFWLFSSCKMIIILFSSYYNHSPCFSSNTSQSKVWKKLKAITSSNWHHDYRATQQRGQKESQERDSPLPRSICHNKNQDRIWFLYIHIAKTH